MKTEVSGDDKLPKLKQKEGKVRLIAICNRPVGGVAKKSQPVQRDSALDEEEKSKERQKINARKYSAENVYSMEEIGDEEYPDQDDKKGFVDKRHQVLYEKEKKRKEEQDRKERELQAIRMNNYEVMKKATEKRQAQYRPSNDMYGALKIGENKDGKANGQNTSVTSGFDTVNERETVYSESKENLKARDSFRPENEMFEDKVRHSSTFQKKKFKIEEEYGMNDELSDDEEEEKVILEEDEEEEGGEVEVDGIQKRIEAMRTQLQEKTMKINELKQTIKKTVL